MYFTKTKSALEQDRQHCNEKHTVDIGSCGFGFGGGGVKKEEFCA